MAKRQTPPAVPAPRLSPAHIDRLAAIGRERVVAPGEVLVEVGVPLTHCFVLTKGSLEVVNDVGPGETLVIVLRPGTFTGEGTMLNGRPGLSRIRAAEESTVIEIERTRLLAAIQSDPELSEIMVPAFIGRRLDLIQRGAGDVVVVGSDRSPGTLRVREFLTRNGHPYTMFDIDRDAGAAELLARFNASMDDIPLVIARNSMALRNPSNEELARGLDFNVSVDATRLRDVVVVGAGPAGLAAAVYAASEGLDVLVIEARMPGGQAGTSSRIENYLGFPNGISGLELASRAFAQASRFGAQFLVGSSAVRVTPEPGGQVSIEMSDGTDVPARTMIVATGASYRRLPLPNVQRFEGLGVYYSATHMEAQLCRNSMVFVVGGGNSAGQAAVYLSQSASQVHLLVRGPRVADSMSQYLVRRIDENPRISLHLESEITALEGDEQLEYVMWRDRDGAAVSQQARHVFTMTGADPSTGWLGGAVALDDQRFIKTGSELSPSDLAVAGWHLARHPHLLETSAPGIFAVGDVRSASVKRTATAVGEGAVAVSLVHRILNATT